ncbi:hypothetical protein BDQ17DRAFT_1184984, partial [Cyathus striatus]
VFEHMITIHLEVTYIWKSRWNVIKVLYVFVKYSTHVDIILNIIAFLAMGFTTSDCKCNIFPSKEEHLLFTAEVILTLRVWAVRGKTRTMTIILVALNIGFLAPMWVAVGFFTNSLE